MEINLITSQIALNDKPFRTLSKKKRDRRLLLFALATMDIVAIVISFLIASLLRLNIFDWSQLSNIILTIAPIHITVALNNKGYQTSALKDHWKSIGRGVTAFLIAASSVLLILFMFKTSEEFSRLVFGIGTTLTVVLIAIFRLTTVRFSQAVFGHNPYADLCIYDDVPYHHRPGPSSLMASDIGLEANPRDPTAVNRLAEVVSGMDRVVLHCSPEKRSDWVFMLGAMNISSEIVVPELDEIRPLAIKRRNGRTSLQISSGQLRWDQKLTKRIFDILFSVAVMIFLSPILLAVAIAIKLTSSGPIFFVQERIGLGNLPFKIYKFRSMRDSDSDALGRISTTRNDQRITPVGRFIRKTSIDELPQFFNVLMGNMSVVGPRPHAKESRAENRLFWDIDLRYWHRHVVKPGLTGLAQIRGYRGATEREKDLSDRLHADLEYLADWTLWKDLRIIAQTFRVIFHKNAY